MARLVPHLGRLGTTEALTLRRERKRPSKGGRIGAKGGWMQAQAACSHFGHVKNLAGA